MVATGFDSIALNSWEHFLMLRVGERDTPKASALVCVGDVLSSARTECAEREDFVEGGSGDCFGTTNSISCDADD